MNLKIIYEQIVKSAKRGYHVSETDMRNSIKQHGLDAMHYKDQEDRQTDGSATYIFLKYDEAISYAEGYNSFLKMQEEDTKEFDIWEVDLIGLELKKDTGLSSGDPMKDSAYYVKSAIPSKRLKLKITIGK